MYLPLFFIAFVPVSICGDKLIHVHAIWRHGERNPWILYHGDLNDASAFHEGLGQLTKNGIRQLYTLGKLFRQRYVKDFQLISPNYISSEIYARSTDFDRAIASAMAFFSGLYSNQSSKDHILAPVPIHSIPTSNDFLNILVLHCPRKDELWKMVDESQVIHSLLNTSHQLFAETSKKAQVLPNFYKVYDIFDAGIVEESFGLTVPPWLSSYFPKWKTILFNYVSALWGLTPFPNDSFPIDLQKELTKISGGSTIDEIVRRWELKIKCHNSPADDCKNGSDQNFYAYSGHDLTEFGLFAGLGFTQLPTENQSWPDYASSIVLELWQTEKTGNSVKINNFDDYYVKIYYYDNSSVETPRYIGDLLPECQGKGCPLSYLIQRAELLRPRPDLKSYCNQSVNMASAKLNHSFAFLIISFVFLHLINK